MDETHHPLIPSWSSTPIPHLSLSAGGLLALADLNTVAKRTAITGGSSWLDAFVLAPGLHYQQAADALDQQSAPALSAELGLTVAIESTSGEMRRYVINNIAMVDYLKRLWLSEGKVGLVTLHVKLAKRDDEMSSLRRRVTGLVNRSGPPRKQKRDAATDDALEMDWLSHIFYLLSPLLTVTAIISMALLDDWWGLSFIVALMLSRIINIWSIKQRSCPPLPQPSTTITFSSPSSTSQFSLPPPPPLRREDSRRTEYTIDLGPARRVVLCGLDADLQAVTTQTWLRARSTLEGYLEATSKLIVYMVACFSGNLSQAGAMVLMSLLLVSAGLLGLSNAHAKGLRVHGRRVGKLRVEKMNIPALDPRMAVDGGEASGAL